MLMLGRDCTVAAEVSTDTEILKLVELYSGEGLEMRGSSSVTQGKKLCTSLLRS